MHKHIHTLTTKYLFTFWTVIITFGVVAALYGIQNNANQDYERAKQEDATQTIAFCHAISDNNQAIRDILLLLSVDLPTTPDMTEAEVATIKLANERRKEHLHITDDTYPVNECGDGYKPESKRDALTQNTTSGTTTTTGG